MRIWWLIPLLLIVSSPSHGQALLRRLSRLADVADAVSMVSSEKDKEAKELKRLLSKNPTARGLLWTRRGVLLLQPDGSSALLDVFATQQGIELPADVAAQFQQRNVLLLRQQVDVFRPAILQVNALRDGAVWAVDGGRAGRLRLMPGTDTDLIYEHREHVYVPHKDERLRRVLRVNAHRADSMVLSLLDEEDAAGRQALDAALGKQHRVANDWSVAQFEQVAREHPRGAVWIVRNRADPTHDAALAALERAAREADVTVLLVRCDGACWSSAEEAKPRPLQASIRAALGQTDIDDTLAALGESSGDWLIWPEDADELRVHTRTELFSKLDDGAPRVRVETASLSPSRDTELMMRFVPGVPGPLQVAYLAGLVFVVMGYKTVVPGWRTLAAPTPGLRSAPLGFAAINLFRGVGFLTMMPVAWALSLAVMIGLWGVPLGIGVSWPYTAWAGGVGVYFGIRWYREHRHEVSDEHWLSRYLAVPVFAAVLMVISGGVVWLLVSGMSWLGMGPARKVHWADTALAVVIAFFLGRVLLRWLVQRNWRPGSPLGWLMVGPLWLIEGGVRRTEWSRRA